MIEKINAFIDALIPKALEQQEAKTKENPEAIFDLVKQGNTVGVAVAIKNDIQPDMTDMHGMTTLHYAAANGAENVTEVLTQSPSAAPWIKDKHGRLPLDMAREAGNHQIGDRLEQLTYPQLFKEKEGRLIQHGILEAFNTKRKALGNPDTKPAFDKKLKANDMLQSFKNKEQSQQIQR